MLVKLWGVRGSLASPLSNEEYNKKIHSIIEHAIASGLKENSQIDKFILPPRPLSTPRVFFVKV